MNDLFYLGAILVLFLASAAYLRGCQSL